MGVTVKQQQQLDYHRKLLANPKVQAMLRTIRHAEGTSGESGYGTRVGGEKFSDYSKKPGKKTYIKSIGDYSTAEGAYQFLNSTWDGVSKKLGLPDFSPESQDIAAVNLIIQRGALGDVLNDDFTTAVNKLSPEWASLPKSGGGSTYKNQKSKGLSELADVFYGGNVSYANSVAPYINQKEEVIIPQISNFDVTPEITNFTTPTETEEEPTDSKQVVDSNLQILQQKQNEKDFLEELYNNTVKQEAPEQQEQQYVVPKTNFIETYNQVSDFVDNPIMQQGGNISQFLKKPIVPRDEKNIIQRDNTNVKKQQLRPLKQLNVVDKADPTLLQKIASFTPPVIAAKKIMSNIAENITPAGYANPIKRVINTGLLNTPDSVNYSNLFKPEEQKERKDYLQILANKPQKYNSLVKSDYRPSNSKDVETTYYKSPATENAIRNYYDKHPDETIDPSLIGSKHISHSNVLGNFTYSSGKDNKGQYLSYYDKWDLNPIPKSGINWIDNTVDEVVTGIPNALGITTTPETYGRVYLDPKTRRPYKNIQENKQQGGSVKEDKEWLQNWYQNRVIPNEEIQNEYFLPQQQDYVNRAKNLKDPKIVDQVTAPNGMQVEGITRANGDIELSKNAAPHAQLHEMSHSINKFPFLMGDIHRNVVEQNIAPKEAINNEDVKKYYDYYSDPEEIHARIQVLRKVAGIKPDQKVTPEFLQSYLKTYKGDNSNINDLLNVADEPHLIEMLNYMADNSKSSGNIQIAQQGGNISQFLKKPIVPRDEKNIIQRDNTNVKKQQLRPIQQLNVRNKTDKEIAQEREAKIQASMLAQKIPYTQKNWREQLAAETAAIGDKLRFSNEPNAVDDSMFNPIQMIAGMASNLGQAPLQAKQTDSNLPYLTSIGAPLAVGAIGGLGTKTTGQFVNNLVNPLAGSERVIKYNKLYNLLPNELNPNLLNAKNGENWIKEWYSNPETKIKASAYEELNPGQSFMDLSGEDKINLAISDLSLYKDKNYIDILKDKGLNKYIKHTLNSQGVSYGVPDEIYTKSQALYGLNKVGRESTKVHELTHLAENNGNILNTKESDALLEPFGYSTKEVYNSNRTPLEVLGSRDKTYYLTPTEIHARMNEARYNLGLKPQDVFTENDYETIKNGVDWFGMGKYIKDKDKFIKLMNNFYTVAPIAGASYLATQEQPKLQQGGNIVDNFRAEHPSVRDLRTDLLNKKIQEHYGKNTPINTIQKDNTITVKPKVGNVATQKEINQRAEKENETAYENSTKQAWKDYVEKNMGEVYQHPLWSLPGTVTPEGVAVMAMQGAAKITPDLYNKDYKSAGMDALMMLPLAPGAVKAISPVIKNAGRVLGTGDLVNNLKLPSISKNILDLNELEKFSAKYGYEVNGKFKKYLSSASNKVVDTNFKKILDQHNTFVRGVSTNLEKMPDEVKNYLTEKGIDFIKNPQQAAEYMATHVPPETGYGRAWAEGLKKKTDVIYTSNSKGTAEGYTYGDGYIVKVKRPTDYSGAERKDWITKNNPETFIKPSMDISVIPENFKSVVKTDYLPYETMTFEGKMKDLANVKGQIEAQKIRDITNKDSQLLNLQNKINTSSKNLQSKKITSDDYWRLNKEVSTLMNKRRDDLFNNFINKNYNTNGGKNINPYAHYLHLGEVGKKVLEPLESFKITPDTWENTSRAHIGQYTEGLSKLQQGGAITDNEKAFLEELKISIGNKPLNVKVLNTDAEKEQGLIGVTKLAKNEAVLLPNSNSDDMRKMSIDTQLVWLDDDYKVIGTQQAKKGKQYKNSNATHFIELHPNINVKVGQKIDLNKERAIEIKPSKIQGEGAFIKENINKGTVIGLAHTNNQPSTELGQYHNHSENPNSENVKIGNNRYLVSLRPMKKGEEITVNYRNQPELEQPEDFKKK